MNIFGAENDRGRPPSVGDEGFLTLVRNAYRNGHLTHSEYRERVAMHGLVRRGAPPSVTVVVTVEHAPFVIVDCLDEAEQRRLLADLAGRRDLPRQIVRLLAPLLDQARVDGRRRSS
jgi:hypothetical protein